MRTFINVMAITFCFITINMFLLLMTAAGAFGGDMYPVGDPIMLAVSTAGLFGSAFIAFIFVSDVEPIHARRLRLDSKKRRNQLKRRGKARRLQLARMRSSRAARESVKDCHQRMDEYEQRQILR